MSFLVLAISVIICSYLTINSRTCTLVFGTRYISPIILFLLALFFTSIMMLSNSPSMLMDKSDLSIKVNSSDMYSAMVLLP